MKNKEVSLSWSVLLFVVVLSNVSLAKTVKVYREKLPGNGLDTIVSARFRANLDEPQLGRAWIEVTAATEVMAGESRIDREISRVIVEGLKFDAKTKQIVYHSEGQAPVICGDVSEGFFRRGHVAQSGKCRIVRQIENDLSDDGFFRTPAKYGVVTLEIE